MKRLMYTLGCALFMASTSYAQDTGTDFMLNTNIKNYKTFSWTDEIDKIPTDAVFIGANGVVVFNNESTRSKIKEAIQYELNGRGYKMQENNADFMVQFIILEQPATLNTYNGYELIWNGLDTVRTEENLEKVQVQPGTILISFIDAKSMKLAWQGYASGVLKPDMINDQVKIRSAISSIFRDYRFKAGNAD
jgi:hypothetical protein